MASYRDEYSYVDHTAELKGTLLNIYTSITNKEFVETEETLLGPFSFKNTVNKMIVDLEKDGHSRTILCMFLNSVSGKDAEKWQKLSTEYNLMESLQNQALQLYQGGGYVSARPSTYRDPLEQPVDLGKPRPKISKKGSKLFQADFFPFYANIMPFFESRNTQGALDIVMQAITTSSNPSLEKLFKKIELIIRYNGQMSSKEAIEELESVKFILDAVMPVGTNCDFNARRSIQQGTSPFMALNSLFACYEKDYNEYAGTNDKAQNFTKFTDSLTINGSEHIRIVENLGGGMCIWFALTMSYLSSKYPGIIEDRNFTIGNYVRMSGKIMELCGKCGLDLMRNNSEISRRLRAVMNTPSSFTLENYLRMLERAGENLASSDPGVRSKYNKTVQSIYTESENKLDVYDIMIASVVLGRNNSRNSIRMTDVNCVETTSTITKEIFDLFSTVDNSIYQYLLGDFETENNLIPDQYRYNNLSSKLDTLCLYNIDRIHWESFCYMNNPTPNKLDKYKRFPNEL